MSISVRRIPAEALLLQRYRQTCSIDTQPPEDSLPRSDLFWFLTGSLFEQIKIQNGTSENKPSIPCASGCNNCLTWIITIMTATTKSPGINSPTVTRRNKASEPENKLGNCDDFEHTSYTIDSIKALFTAKKITIICFQSFNL